MHCFFVYLICRKYMFYILSCIDIYFFLLKIVPYGNVWPSDTFNASVIMTGALLFFQVFFFFPVFNKLNEVSLFHRVKESLKYIPNSTKQEKVSDGLKYTAPLMCNKLQIKKIKNHIIHNFNILSLVKSNPISPIKPLFAPVCIFLSFYLVSN